VRGLEQISSNANGAQLEGVDDSGAPARSMAPSSGDRTWRHPGSLLVPATGLEPV